MKKTMFKKSISLMLTVLMIMSCWVFFPGMVPEASAAAESVNVTTSFTLSPNGNRGNDGSWTRLALTGESAAAGTSVVLFRFTNADLKNLADKDEINLQFYAYSCNNRLSHNNVGVTVNADVYYITNNGSFVSNQGTNKSTNVADTGNSVLGTDYTYSYAQNSAKSYFGLSDNTLVGSFEQPNINGQDYAALRTGDANCTYPVTDIVKEKAASGEDLSFIVMLRQGYSCSGDRGWSDIYINSDSIALSGYDMLDMLEELKSKIEYYEECFANGVFYTNLVNNYKAYNDAKRYYDAVTYGGAQFDAATAQGYMNAIDTAIANTGLNDTYVDYLNTEIKSQNGSAIGDDFRKNVIWYPWDFSWDITNDTALWSVQNTRFYWTMPNIIVGITDDSETTFPLHTFFWTDSSSRYIRYIIAGSGTGGDKDVVGSSDLSAVTTWRVSTYNNGHTVSNWAAGDQGWGDWVYESGYDSSKSIDHFEDNSNNLAYSQPWIYQASTYAQINKSTVGVNSSNIFKQVNTGFTFGTSKSANNGTTDYKSGYASTSGINGYVYVVYMNTYKNNYQNWKTLIPAISYKDYNGFVYSDATNVTTYLDKASALSLNHGLTESNRSGDISSTVQVWATNVNDGATHLANAKSAGTTRVTNKYVDLINAISNAEATYASGNAKYTYASWNNFVAAYNAAKAHMASLNPAGSNAQYSSNGTEIGNLATALTNAQNALEKRTFDVTYENMFSFSSWVNSASGCVGTPDKGSMTYDINAGTITVKNNGANTQSNPNDHYTSHGFGNGHYNMTLVPGETYTFEYTTSGGTGDQVHIFFYDADGNPIENKANSGNPFANVYGTGNGTHTMSFTAPENATKAAFRFGTTVLGETVTFSDIFMYSHTRGDYADIAGWTYSPNRTVFTYDIPLGQTLEVPARPGYTFNGWWVDSINPNGQKDDGEQVTDGNGTVVSLLQNFGITQDWVLHSEWTINEYTVTFKKADGTTTSAQYEYGTPASSIVKPDNTASDNDASGHHSYSWPAISDVTGDVTYEEVREDENHSYTSSVTTPSTCIQDGVRTYECSCGHSYTEVITANGHTPGAEATCTAPQTCTVCQTELAPVKGHTPAAAVRENETPATCKMAGSYEEVVYCSVCHTQISRETKTIDKLAHTEEILPAVESTCTSTGLTEGKKCSVCGEILVAQSVTEKKAHSMGEWSQTKAPTCITAGEKTRKCANCDYTEKDSIAATGVHIYSNWSQYGDKHRRTCTADINCEYAEEEAHKFNGTLRQDANNNYHDYKCEKCDAYGVGEKINEKEACFGEGTTFLQIDGNDSQHKETCKCGREKNDAHAYGTWVADPENINDNQGKMSRVCSECKYKQTSSCKYKETGRKNATCTDGGYITYVCQDKDCINGYTEILAATGHNFDETVKANAATCTETGTEAYKLCKTCNLYFAESAETTATDGKTDTSSFVIGALGHDEVSHEAKAPTCTEKGWEAYVTCSRCDYTTYVEKAKLGHYEESHEAKAPTCTEIGWDAYVTCSRCDYTTYVEKEKLGHDEESHEAKAPTCTEIGWDSYVTCSRCDYTTYVEKEKLGHNEESHEAKAPTCTEIGWDAYVTCSRCNYSTYVEKAALGHDYATIFTVDKKATCTEDGSKSKHCSRCSSTTEVTTIIARGHNIVDTTEEKAATCIDTGIMNQKCSNTAGDEYEVCEYTTTRVIPAKGHTFSDIIVAKEATCIATGNKAYKQCTTCNLYFAEDAEKDSKDGEKDTTSFILKIDSTNHKNTTNHEETAATCLTVGYTAGEFCEDCQKWISGHTEIPAIAHKDKVYHEKVPATCVATGTIEYWSCPNCKTNFSNEECTVVVTDLTIEIDPDNHTKLVKTGYKAETCEEPGNIDYWTCEGCGKIYSDESAEIEINQNDTVIPAKGHNYGDWKFVADGEHKRVCKNDVSHTETEKCSDIDSDDNCKCDKCGNLVAHNWGNATCDAPATCTVCGEKSGDALGHDWDSTTYSWIKNDGAWICTAERSCKRNGCTHSETATANVTSAVKTPATCTEKGWTTYTATFTETWVATQTKDVQDIEALNHKWSEVTYTWGEDGKSCTAQRVCKNDANHVEKATATITSKVTTPATCVAMGITTYTATFDNDWTEQQTTTRTDVAIDHSNHDIVSVDSKTPTCTEIGWDAYEYCQRSDCKHTTYVEKPATGHNFGGDPVKATANTHSFKCINADCNAIGVGVGVVETGGIVACAFTSKYEFKDKDYHTAYCICGNTSEINHIESVKATCTTQAYCDICKSNYGDSLGHDWAETTYNFAADGSSCTATRVCKNNASHVETATATITSAVKTPATCEGKGTTTYTATFTETWASEKTKDIQDIAAINHDYDRTKSEDNLTRPVENADGTWTKGYYTYKCKNDKKHTTTEDVDRASYINYEAAWNSLEGLLSTDLTADAKAAIQTVLDNNNIGKNLIVSEQDTVDTAEANLKAAFEQYKGQFKTYIVTFVIDGKEIKVEVVSGQSATAPTDLTKAYDDTYHYKFTGWDNAFTNITSDLTVTAQFDAIEHSIKHDDKDDTYHTDKCDCGYSKDVKHTETSAVTTKATCEADGLRTYTCSVCGGTRTETIAMRAHVYKDNGVKTPATCIAEGEMNTICTNPETETHAACVHESTKVIAIDPNAHSWDEVTYSWIADGKECTAERICKNEASHVETTTANATSAVKTPATCEGKGTTTYTATFTETWATEQTKDVQDIPVLGHKDDDKDHACDNGCTVYQGKHIDNDKNHICDYGCQEEIGTHADSAEDKDHVCDYGCGTVLESCNSSEWIIETPAACEVKGSKYKECTICGIEMAREEIKALEHNMQLTAEKIEPKCEVPGKEAVYTCANGCGKTTGGEEIGALEHNMQLTAEKIEPKCEVPGKEAVYTCANGCGKTTGGEEIGALEHNMQLTAEKIEPKCEVAGKEAVYTCANGCGKTTGGEVIAALDHEMKLTEAAVKATCISEGKTAVYTCENGCGKTEGGTVVDILDHSYTGEFRLDYASEKKTHSQKCVNGCETYSEATNCTFESVKYEANCESDGYVLHTCTVCKGNYKTDVVLASGHKWGAWEHIDGTNTHERICEINEEHTEIVTCVTTNRYVAPTCIKDGISEDICTECNYKYSSKKVSAHGHRYIDEDGKENAVIVSPSCTTQGSKYLVCILCDAKTEPELFGRPIGHYFHIEKGYGATCTEDGYTDYKHCLREDCDYVEHPETIKATGHKDDGKGNCIYCSKPLYEGGSKACSCLCHSDSVLMKFIYKIVLFFWKLFRIKGDCPCGDMHY